MNWPAQARDIGQSRAPSLRLLAGYLRATGWAKVTEDDRTSAWRKVSPAGEELIAVLPAREDFKDYGQIVHESLQVLSYLERRTAGEISADLTYGPSDTLAARLVPDAPPGEAPLSLAYSALAALRSFVIGSGSAIDSRALVLPARRPPRAESYVSKVRVAARPGSFVLSLALPLFETFDEAARPDAEAPAGEGQEEPEPVTAVSPEPFGRRIASRMASVAQNARKLADAVKVGNQPVRAFGEAAAGQVPNATELEALATLGGPEHSPYQLRFAQSPLAAGARDAVVVRVTADQQRIMTEAAEFLRSEQPRVDVTVEGVVVRLSRDHRYGSGVAVIEGIGDDSGAVRRFYLELAERDYEEAIRAHREGLRVVARGDVSTRGSYKWLRPASSFAVIPGLEY